MLLRVEFMVQFTVENWVHDRVEGVQVRKGQSWSENDFM